MNRVLEILMRRDNLTQQEAEDRVLEVKQMMEDCNYDPEECVDIMCDELGLEMDYIEDVLFNDIRICVNNLNTSECDI